MSLRLYLDLGSHIILLLSSFQIAFQWSSDWRPPVIFKRQKWSSASYEIPNAQFCWVIPGHLWGHQCTGFLPSFRDWSSGQSPCFCSCKGSFICLWIPEFSKANDWLGVQFYILASIATQVGSSWGEECCGRQTSHFKRCVSCIGDRLVYIPLNPTFKSATPAVSFL